MTSTDIAKTNGDTELSIKGQAKKFLTEIAPDLIAFFESEKGNERFAINAVREIMADDRLLQDPKGLAGALVKVARYRLALGKEAAHVAIIPRWNKKRGMNDAELQIMAQGFIQMMVDAGMVKNIRTDVVYANDHILINLNDRKNPIVHTPAMLTMKQIKAARAREGDNYEGARGGMVGCYAIAYLNNGDSMAEWLDMEDIEKIMLCVDNRDKQTGEIRDSSPWVRFMAEMMKKSAVRRIAKRIPKTRSGSQMDVRLEEAMLHDNRDFNFNAKPLPPATAGQGTAKVLDAMSASASPPAPPEPPAPPKKYAVSFLVFKNGTLDVERAEGDPMPDGKECPACGKADVWDKDHELYICPSPATKCERSKEYAHQLKTERADAKKAKPESTVADGEEPNLPKDECKHFKEGNPKTVRRLIEGESKKNGKPYAMWVCPLDKDDDDSCDPNFVSVDDPYKDTAHQKVEDETTGDF